MKIFYHDMYCYDDFVVLAKRSVIISYNQARYAFIQAGLSAGSPDPTMLYKPVFQFSCTFLSYFL